MNRLHTTLGRDGPGVHLAGRRRRHQRDGERGAESSGSGDESEGLGETKGLGWSVKDGGREAPLLNDAPHKTSFLPFFIFAALFSC